MPMLMPVDAATAQQGAMSALEKAGAPANDVLSPPFPAHWPPAPGSEVLFFSFAMEPLPTGEVLYELSSPGYVVRMVPTAAGMAAARVESRVASSLGRAPHERTLEYEELNRAAESLFRSLLGQSLSPSEEQQLHATYATWFTENPALAAVLEREVPDFFHWAHTALAKKR